MFWPLTMNRNWTNLLIRKLTTQSNTRTGIQARTLHLDNPMFDVRVALIIRLKNSLPTTRPHLNVSL